MQPATDPDPQLWQISQEGMFIRLDQAPPVLDGIRISCQLPEGPVSAVVQVRSFLPKGAFVHFPEVSGVGCLVTQMPPASRHAVAAYIKRMQQVYSQLQFQLALNRPVDPALVKEACLSMITDRDKLKEQVLRTVRQLSKG